jgi:DNA uptake protein ComE-like DNA-binding protein
VNLARLRGALIATAAVVFCGLAPARAADPLDLNRATRAEIEALPIPSEVAKNIWEYRTYVRYFRSIYDVAEVEGVTPEILSTLRPLVATLPPPAKDAVFERYDASFRQVQQYLSQEGSREELAEEYLDLLRDPRDINELDLLDLQGFQNVSPVDAVAILQARERAGRIENERQLRSSDGLSYWGFRNLRDFVLYEEPARSGELHGDAQLLAFDRPYRLDEAEMLYEPLPPVVPDQLDDFENGTAWGVRGLDSPNAALGLKLRLRLGSQWKGGLFSFRNVGEEHFGETMKGFVSWRGRGGRRYALDRVVAGHYRVALGQGLVMDNTDFFLARKNGYGFNTRPRRILGDLTRTQEFALRGLAVEGHAGPVRATGFVSRDQKDAIVNPDGTLNRYIVMAPRFENSELEAMRTQGGVRFGIRRDAFRETLYGGNLQAHAWTGTYIGISGYEARSDAAWNPDINVLIADTNELDARDVEIYQGYDSRHLGNFRRVVGAEFQTVYRNLALQGEYAKLDSNPANGLEGLFSAAPEAFTVSAYMQWEDLNLQVLWRDYDVGFDNPYARAFSNDSRYEQTLLVDPFRLQNPLYSSLALETPQMKPERGVYGNLRYRVSRTFTISQLEFDDWIRADGQNSRRWVARLDWVPIFPLRFQVRQRFSSRGEQVEEDVRHFRGWETRFGVQARLSSFDTIELLYSQGKTQFAERPRLSGSPDPSPAPTPPLNTRTGLGEEASNGQAIVGLMEHNFNEGLQFQVGTLIYDGFVYWFEDNEFLLLDGNGIRSYFVVRSRIGDELLLRFKVAHERPFTNTNLDLRDFRNIPFNYQPFDGDRVRQSFAWFRVQLDYTF